MTSPTRAALSAPVLVALLSACASTPSGSQQSGENKAFLERVDDTTIAQLRADGFAQLPRQDRLLCYHLVQAAIAGRDIFLDQRFAYALEIRDVLEELYVHDKALPEASRKEIERFTKLFWVHSGIHHNLSTLKMPFHLDADAFLAACVLARKDGAKLPTIDRLRFLHDVITNPSTFVSVTSKSAADGADPVRDSCNNLYVGVTSADLEHFVAGGQREVLQDARLHLRRPHPFAVAER